MTLNNTGKSRLSTLEPYKRYYKRNRKRLDCIRRINYWKQKLRELEEEKGK